MSETEELLTPEEHARATENVLVLKGRRTINGVGIGETFTATHVAASQLHGWSAHAQATTEPFKLSRTDYVAALESAADGANPHAGAVSPFAPKTTPNAPRAAVPAAYRKVRR